LKPARTAAGYRLYQDSDLARLEQIVALKFIGFPLKKIKMLLDRDSLALSKVLRGQRRALEEKRRLLDSAIAALAEVESALAGGQEPHASVMKRIIEVIEMQNNSDWMLKYFTDDAKSYVAARKTEWTPEQQAHAEQEWSDLFRDIQASLDEDPASPKAQAFVDRWNRLIAEFVGGQPEVAQGIKAMWSDRPNWPAEFHEKTAPFADERVWDFFRKAVAARNSQGGGQGRI
jgi:DNA-binding transcriptional MerR regulator